MLVIRRGEGESILFSGGIEVTVLEAGPRKVVLGIKAPEEVVVMRKEVVEAGEANRSAALAGRRLEAGELAKLFLKN